MSNEIDWSKAPEGYPVWIQDLTGQKPDGSGWHREEIVAGDDGSCERWTDMDGRFWPKDCEARGRIIVHRNPVGAWTGTGLPPVGTVCETERNEFFRRVEILYIGVERVFVRDENGEEIALLLDGRQFFPVRTKEQIEADEREKAVQEMQDIVNSTPVAYRVGLYALYDAGYRKTEAGK